MEAGNISWGQVVPGVEEMVEWGWVAEIHQRCFK